MLLAATALATLLIANPSTTDADRIAANGGFLLGNAHRCGIDPARIERAGKTVRGLIAAASDDAKAEDGATLRFAQFFLVSAFADTGKDKLVASCRTVDSEFARLERHPIKNADAGE